MKNSEPLHVITIVGARPQFIKAAPVSAAMRRHGVVEQILHTGQHYDRNMSGRFFDELGIQAPEWNLGVGSMSHGKQTGRMLEGIEQVLLEEKPDVLLVYGDTNSTLAGALAAVKLHIPVAHVEAGLRSFNRQMPEEINRILADHASDLLFTPTALATENLGREGIPEHQIEQAGDVMYDATLLFGEKSEKESRILETHGLSPGNFILATVHRAENTDQRHRLENIVEALGEISAETEVVLPLHPRTKKKLEAFGLMERVAAKIRVIGPAGYLDMLSLEKHAKVIMTDSGGVQKEAYFQGVPCITLRDETEWVELVDAGWNRLASPDSSGTIMEAWRTPFQPRGGSGFYGDGHASDRIVKKLLKEKRKH